MNSQQSSRADTSGALLPAVILFGGMTLLLVGLLASRPAIIPPKSAEVAPTGAATTVAAEVTAETTQEAQTVAAALDPAMVKAGENSFQTTCSACHGFNAMGIPGLGKTLIGSQFVNSQTDDQLLAFLQVGRPVTDPLNTTGVQMPARGGNPSLTDDKLREIIAYIRSLNQGAGQSGAGATPTVAATTATGAEATSEPFTPLDLSGLAVPTSIGGAESTAQPTAVPSASAAEVTNEPFTPLDLSGLAVPTSISGGSEPTAVPTSEATASVSAEVTTEPFTPFDLSGLPVPTSISGSN